MAENDGSSAKRPTIYDLAEIAGTSPSAVSSILNGTWKKRRISKKLAERVSRIATEQGYAVNLQASLLRRDRSRIIGMIVPKYDNRYFGAIAEQFEIIARAQGLFPVITCTQRDPDLEFAAARELVSYQAEWLIVTGATDPDRIGQFCAAAGVRVINLDLPGRNAPSVVSDNFTGAHDLTGVIFSRLKRDFGVITPLWFIGGRGHDHNTAERLRGFKAAHQKVGLTVRPERIITPGYSPEKAASAMRSSPIEAQSGLFVNSTITLEGVIRGLSEQQLDTHQVRLGCFDWDTFAALMPQMAGMIEQDVPRMLTQVFKLIEAPPADNPQIKVPCILRSINHSAPPFIRG